MKTPEIYTTHPLDWLTFRRNFTLRSAQPVRVLHRQLSELAALPAPTSPLAPQIAVALSSSDSDVILFEVYILRGLPNLPPYCALMASGRIRVETQAQGNNNPTTLITGQIQPQRQGFSLYLAVMSAFLLWVVAAFISATLSPFTSFVPALVALLVMLAVSALIGGLLTRDFALLLALLRSLR